MSINSLIYLYIENNEYSTACTEKLNHYFKKIRINKINNSYNK